MDSRLIYHTSLHDTSALAPPLKKVEYHTSLQSTDIALENLKKVNNKLEDNNIVTLAYLANNSCLNNEDREKYSNKLKELAMKEYHIISTYVNDIIRRNEDSSTNESERNN